MNPVLSMSVLSSFQDAAKNHPLWNHPFLVRCSHEQLTLSEVRALAVQMYHFCNTFHRILATILASCPDVDAQHVILENLLDEMGGGDPQASHPELFKRFTRALGIDDATLVELPLTPGTNNLIETYFSLAPRYDYLIALAVVCFASEGIVGILYQQIQQGILGATELSDDALIFFEMHIHVDDSHAANLAALLEPRITSPQQIHTIETAIVQALDARIQFFDDIQRQTAHMQPTQLVNV